MPPSSITLLYPQVIVSRPWGECKPPTCFAGPKIETQNLGPKIVRHFNTLTAELSIKCQSPLKSYVPTKPTLERKSDDGFRDSLFLLSPLLSLLLWLEWWCHSLHGGIKTCFLVSLPCLSSFFFSEQLDLLIKKSLTGVHWFHKG